MTEIDRAVCHVLSIVSDREFKSATKFLSKTLVVKATRRHRPDKRDRSTEYVITIGKPNFEARQFIARHEKAKAKFVGAYLAKRWPAKKK